MFLTTEKRKATNTHEKTASILRPDSGQSPLGFAAGDQNLYRYVGNSPTNRVDPSGLAETTIYMTSWLAKLQEKHAPEGIKTPPNWTAQGITAWAGGLAAAGFTAAGDIASYLVILNLLRKNGLGDVHVIAPEKDGKFTGGPLEVVPNGKTKSEVDLTFALQAAAAAAGPVPALGKFLGKDEKGGEIGKIGYDVTFKATEIRRTDTQIEFRLAMTIEITAGPIKATIKDSVPGVLTAGKDQKVYLDPLNKWEPCQFPAKLGGKPPEAKPGYEYEEFLKMIGEIPKKK